MKLCFVKKNEPPWQAGRRAGERSIAALGAFFECGLRPPCRLEKSAGMSCRSVWCRLRVLLPFERRNRCLYLIFMDFVFIARDHMRMYLMATRPWICISTTKKACERSLIADDEEKIAEISAEFIEILTEIRAHTENQAVYRRDAGHIAPRLVLRVVRSYRSFTRRTRTFAARRIHQISCYLFLIRRAKRVTRAKRGDLLHFVHIIHIHNELCDAAGPRPRPPRTTKRAVGFSSVCCCFSF